MILLPSIYQYYFLQMLLHTFFFILSELALGLDNQLNIMP